MESTLLVSEHPGRSLAIHPNGNTSGRRSGTGSSKSYVLVLEQPKGSSSSTSTSALTARFQPTSTFDGNIYEPMMALPVKGCLGLVQVDGGMKPFLGVITDCTVIGELEGSTVYRIDNVMFFSLTSKKYDQVANNGAAYLQKRDPSTMSGGYQSAANVDYMVEQATAGGLSEQYETVKHPCRELQRLICSGSFYFSSAFDLTRTAQVRLQSTAASSCWETSDARFFWNRHIIKELLKFRKQLPDADQAELDRQGLLVMATSGFVRIDMSGAGADQVTIAIISRLSCMRAGTRFNTRGIDDDGNVANNVETEVLVYAKNLCYSYVLVRGSVPVFWEQQGLQLGKHTIQISRGAAATQPAVERHFRNLIQLYGKQVAVNLLGEKEGSAELELSDAYNKHVDNLDPEMRALVRIVNFDFHAAVKGNQFENLDTLVRQLLESIKEFGYFLINLSNRQVISTQQGAFRVNCLDCLDRTNVVEGLICKASLQTFATAVLKVSADTLFTACLNDMWADNGDELSRIYTGTGALKSGFTRTGKRTIAGFLDDAKKSATRFVQNTFQDKYKQEVIDLLLGKLSGQNEIRLYNPIREAVTSALEQRSGEFSSKTNIRVHVASWNVNAKQPLGESLSTWLSFNGGTSAAPRPEVYVVGFQEIVELSPQQIMATDSNKRLVWEDVLLKTINAGSQQQYVLLKSGQLVGAALCIFVRADLVSHIRNVDGAIKKTGMAGLAGNKGGVAIRMDIFDTSVCFVCAHLAAGHKNMEERDQDYRTISEGLMFTKGRRIQDHGNVVWLGDFNYRIDLPNEEVRSAIESRDLQHLIKHDQLINQMRRERAFQGFSEGPINFLPTYKFDNGTSRYDTSEKNRIPAWTDRVIFCGKALRQLGYDRAEMVSSDHKPVKALFDVELRRIDKEKMELIQQELYRRFTNDPNAIKFAASSGDSGSRSVATRSLPALIDFGDAPSVSIPAAPSISKQPSVATPTLNWWDAPNDIGAEFDGKFQSLSAAPSLRGSMTSTTSSVAPPPLPSRTNAAFLAPTAPASESHSTNISAAGTPSIPHKPAFLVTTSAVPAPFTSTNVVDNARALPPPRLPPRETSPAGIFPIPPLQQQQPSSSGFILAPPHSQQQTLSSRSTPAPPLPQAKRCPPVPIMSASPSNLPAYTDPNAHGGPQHRP